MTKKELCIVENYSPQADVTLFCGDRLELLNQIINTGNKAELIITSPPYNIGKEYEKVVPLDIYIEDQKKTIETCLRLLSPTGSICWQVGNYIEGSGKEKEAFPLDIILYPIFKKCGLKLKNRIIWTFGHGLNESFRFSGRHETILWFTRNTANFTFNLDPIRVPQKYPGKKSFKGKNAGKYSGNPLGKNPEDVWDMPNVKSNHPEKTEHPCQFPIGLIERFVLGMTNPGDLVIDPYIGVGTTAIAAYLNNRKSAGADNERDYLDIARQRLEMARNGTLPIRDRDMPVYDPSQSNLSKIPEEWKKNQQG
jgi:adenine-specific DNA-methyltransferase